MSSTLTVTTTLAGDHFLVSAVMSPDGTLPREVFIYPNVGDGTLGEFFGTCNVQELGTFPVLTLGTPQPVFGNRYLRHYEAKIIVPLDQDPVPVVSALVTNVKTLSTAYSTQTGSTATFIIP